MPLAARPIDRAAHHRLDEDWLMNALGEETVLVMLMQDGAPLVQSGGGLVWLGPQAKALEHIKHSLFLGLDKQGSAIFALDMQEAFDIENAPISVSYTHLTLPTKA